MGTIVKVKKTRTAEAVLITDEKSEAVVREWLSRMGVEDADLTRLIEERVWFLRDEGDDIVYLVHPADFISFYEEVEESSIGDNPFTFD